MLLLKDISKKHSDWIAIALYLGCPKSTAEDVVQDTYLKLHAIQNREGNLNRLATPDGSVNKAYLFKSIQNVYIDSIRQKKRIPYENTENINQAKEEVQVDRQSDLFLPEWLFNT